MTQNCPKCGSDKVVDAKISNQYRGADGVSPLTTFKYICQNCTNIFNEQEVEKIEEESDLKTRIKDRWGIEI
jgi:transposase-like protein